MATDSKHQKLDELQGNLMNYALMLTSDYDDARALVKDTMVTALHEEDKSMSTSQLKKRVYSLMRSIFKSKYSQNVHHATVVDAADHIFSLLASEAAISHLKGVHETVEISASINQLSDHYRTPYALFLKGYRTEEIASRTSMPVRMVRRIIYAAHMMVNMG